MFFPKPYPKPYNETFNVFNFIVSNIIISTPGFKVILFFLVLVLSYTNPAFSDEQKALDKQLFISIYHCDVAKIKSLISQGANVNAYYDTSLNSQLRMTFTGEYTPLAYAQLSMCLPVIEDIEKPEQKFKFVIDKVSEIIEVLINAGADPHKLLKVKLSRYDAQLPAMRVAFHSDVGAVLALPFFKKMVELGGDPNIADSKGNNVIWGANRTELDIKQYTTLLGLGVDYNHTRPDGHNMSSGFPSFFSNTEKLKKMIQKIKGSIDFTKGDYKESHYSHPLVREINYVISDFRTYDNRQLRKQLIEDDLAALLDSVLNIEIGKDSRHPLAYLMSDICPTTQYSDRTYFTFEAGYTVYSNAQKLKMKSAYNWFRHLIRTLNFDLNHKDSHGLNLITYAINLCPYEVVNDIYQITKTLPDVQQLQHRGIRIDGTRKAYSDTVFFNNDHRTIKFLIDNGIPVEYLEQFIALSTNPEINQLVTPQKQSWRKLKNIGLDYTNVVNIPARINYQYNKYTDIKTTTFELTTPSAKKSFVFSGKPISALIGKTNGSKQYRGLNIKKNSKGIDFYVTKDTMHYRIWGSTGPGGTVLLSEISDDLKTEIIFSETKTLQTKPVNFSDSETITFNQKIPYLLDIPNNPLRSASHDLVFNGATGDIFCSALLCRYFIINKISKNTSELSLDITRLRRQQPHAIVLWDYLNTPIENRKPLRNKMRSMENKDVYAYFPDLIQTQFKDLRQEDESLDLIDILINLEFESKLPFTLQPFLDRLHKIATISAVGQSYIDNRLFLLTGKSIETAYQKTTSNYSQLEEYVLLLKSVNMSDKYMENYNRLYNKIIDNIDNIAKDLNLSEDQIKTIMAQK